jgi:hypothetical protein
VVRRGWLGLFTLEGIMLFHITAPMPRRGTVNAFYPIGTPRFRKTLCGATWTNTAIRYSWQAFAVGKYEPCQECIEIRKAAKRAARTKA